MGQFLLHDAQTIGCSELYVFVVCAVYSPPCLTGIPHPLPPCRYLCEHALQDCRARRSRYDLSWPTNALTCDQLPDVDDGDSTPCLDFDRGNFVLPDQLDGLCPQYYLPGETDYNDKDFNYDYDGDYNDTYSDYKEGRDLEHPETTSAEDGYPSNSSTTPSNTVSYNQTSMEDTMVDSESSEQTTEHTYTESPNINVESEHAIWSNPTSVEETMVESESSERKTEPTHPESTTSEVDTELSFVPETREPVNEPVFVSERAVTLGPHEEKTLFESDLYFETEIPVVPYEFSTTTPVTEMIRPSSTSTEAPTDSPKAPTDSPDVPTDDLEAPSDSSEDKVHSEFGDGDYEGSGVYYDSHRPNPEVPPPKTSFVLPTSKIADDTVPEGWHGGSLDVQFAPHITKILKNPDASASLPAVRQITKGLSSHSPVP